MAPMTSATRQRIWDHPQIMSLTPSSLYANSPPYRENKNPAAVTTQNPKARNRLNQCRQANTSTEMTMPETALTMNSTPILPKSQPPKKYRVAWQRPGPRPAHGGRPGRAVVGEVLTGWEADI